MIVLGVIDLLNGQAVHARGGRRDRYQPVVKSVGAPIVAGDSVALAGAYLNELGADGLYAADLNAILGGQTQETLIAALSQLGAPLWIDAGTDGAAQAIRVRDLGASHVVIGLETLPSYEALDEICGAVGGQHVAFSLDVRDGNPVTRPGSPIEADRIEAVAVRAAQSGVSALIVLDLARVGTGLGPDIDLTRRVRKAAPDITLLAGGGVRGTGDLEELEAVGCDGALVATALLSGALRLTPSPIPGTSR